MLHPPYLKKGDKIAIVASARKIEPGPIQDARKVLEEWGFHVELSKHLFDEDNQYAGSDKARADDLQKALDDPSIKAILFARGGYGTVRLMEYLDFSTFIKQPKWLIGFSDITVIHNAVHQLNICSLHAEMSLNFKRDWQNYQALVKLKDSLAGNNLEYSNPSHQFNRTGTASGIITGGNLSVLYSLSGTKYDIDTKGKVLFLEDLDEYLYHIDRMMMNLKLSGKLDHLAGLIVGSMTKMRDNSVPFGKNAYEIIHDVVSEYDFPVAFDFPAGHIEDNYPLVIGANVKLEVDQNNTNLTFI